MVTYKLFLSLWVWVFIADCIIIGAFSDNCWVILVHFMHLNILYNLKNLSSKLRWFIPVFFLVLQNKEEVMAVRLREADSIAAVAELQQHIAELEIQVWCVMAPSLCTRPTCPVLVSASW